MNSLLACSRTTPHRQAERRLPNPKQRNGCAWVRSPPPQPFFYHDSTNAFTFNTARTPSHGCATVLFFVNHADTLNLFRTGARSTAALYVLIQSFDTMVVFVCAALHSLVIDLIESASAVRLTPSCVCCTLAEISRSRNFRHMARAAAEAPPLTDTLMGK